LKVQGFGSFIKKAEHIFRLNAELIFGEGNGPIILGIGLNPGSCQLMDREDWNSFLQSDSLVVTGEIKLDRTMLHISEMVLEAQPHFQGKVNLNNLMNYRNGNMNEALSMYKHLKRNGLYLNELETDFNPLLKKHPGSIIWLGWSLKRSARLNARKDQVYTNVITSCNRIIAKYPNESPSSPHPHVGHFCPQLQKDALAYRSYIMPKLRAALTEVQYSQ
jgi:pentatricopeptide repeat protein